MANDGPALPLVLTPGEPAGVCPEITAKAWAALRSDPHHAFAVIGDADFLQSACNAAKVPVTLQVIDSLNDLTSVFKTALPVLHRRLPEPVTTGRFSTATAGWVMNGISEAVDLCLAGEAAAMVTNPIQKEALYGAGFAFQGHTDFLADLARRHGHAAQDVMMLVGAGLRTVPVTVHIPLKDVAASLSQEAIVTQGLVVNAALRRYFGIAQPRIAVTGLNPHAGENGTMGREEIDTVIPAIQALRAKGLSITGPLPADTAFFPEARKSYDAILCMYHDQALIPVKTLDFHGGVNVTLGLPFIRTSPDHGTALGLAGQGTAQAESLLAAIRMARAMADNAARAT